MVHDDLKALIIHNLDVVDFLDILGLELSDLVDLLEDHIEEHQDELKRAAS